MEKNILNEINSMKYLLGYKRGIVISEQVDTENETRKAGNAIDDANNAINSIKNPGSQPEMFGGYNNPNAAIKQATDMLSNFTGFNTQTSGLENKGISGTAAGTSGLSGTAAGTSGLSGTAAGTSGLMGTTPVTPIKIGVKYPSIVELQTLLNTKSQAGLTTDGKYGPKTSASVLSALQNLPKTDTNAINTNTTTDTTDASSAAIKKTAETGVQTTQGDNKGGATGETQSNNKTIDVDLNSIIG